MKKFKRPKLLLGILAGVILPPISAVAIACSQAQIGGTQQEQQPGRPQSPGTEQPAKQQPTGTGPVTPVDQASVVKANFSSDKSTLTIGNNQLQRVFSLANNKVVTKSVTNDLTAKPTTIEFGDKTQEFQIHLMGSNGFINANDLTLSKTPEIVSIDSGLKIVFSFNPISVAGIPYTITENVWMTNGDSFIRKDMNISVPQDQAANAKIDYIDLDVFDFGKLSTNTYLNGGDHWSVPKQADNPDMSNMPGAYLELGQPFYTKAMYFGSEFPMTENKIVQENGTSMGLSRYFYGKSLAPDTQFNYSQGNDNNLNGSRTTWATVMGAAHEDNYNVIQQDFFKYIESISTKVQFRPQYNSWYDHMKNITAENIKSSFNQVEHGFSNYGVAPLKSYVIDDGWPDYNSFWQINNKFNGTFEPSVSQVEKLGSEFGLWLGPRGGYGTEAQISSHLQSTGQGSVNENDGSGIDVSDGNYLNKLENDIFLKYQKEYDIGYWKLDGMLLKPSNNANHNHVIGGSNIEGTANGMYTVSETYERWTDIFKVMRQERSLQGKDFWINLTSYVNPSPWLLQWVDSVWIQTSADSDLTNHADPGSVVGKIYGNSTDHQMENELNYRDEALYKLADVRQWQFPFKNMYVHDPVYANTMFSGKGNYEGVTPHFTPAELRTYLYMLGTRGNAFWEFYYSPNLFTEGHWMVNSEAVNWIQNNYSILQNSHRIGGQPINGDVYGYSAWNGDNGIVSLINPNNKVQTYDLTFDNALGVTPGTTGLYRKVILGNDSHGTNTPINYGHKETVTLQPNEALIWQFSKTQDITPPTIATTKVNNNGTKIRVQFNERITSTPLATPNEQIAGTVDPNNFTIANNKVTSANVLDDLRTVELTLQTPLKDGQVANLSVKNISDPEGNKISDASTSVTSYNNDVINAMGDTSTVADASKVSATTMSDGSKALQLTNTGVDSKDSHGVTGNKAFSIYFSLQTKSSNALLLNQGDQYSVKINSAGQLAFTVGNQTVTSESVVNDDNLHNIVLVRENNGAVRIYVNGQVDATGYNKDGGIANIQSMPITLGSSTFNGKVGRLTVVDHSIPYNEAAELNNATVHDLAAGLTPIAAFTSNNQPAPVNEARPLSLMTDGNDDTDNSYGEFGSDNIHQSEYVQIDLGHETDISNIHMVRYYKDNRTYDATVVATSDNADFSNPTIFYNSDTNNVHGLGKGTDDKYAETPDGRTFNPENGAKSVKARYVRVYMYGRTDGAGNTNHIVTLNVNGSVISPDYNQQIVTRLQTAN
ncbi:LamG-like jellyroll fold domain-containing protein [[Mycoplasma] testudinis]|uniref:LamG-like jellyroll fold domain-containing protein n=1 Tax=[Mycoplasma] testudinis TaxID=33924 RepID=UPI000697D306|nr:LamG-like jellyroll fold domain-containing protein [[Mycoplasma] testudinis]